MGYAIIYGFCVGCGQPFGFNPTCVPSIRIDGEKQAVCKTCAEEVNRLRAEKGLSTWDIAPDAYEPFKEERLN